MASLRQSRQETKHGGNASATRGTAMAGRRRARRASERTGRAPTRGPVRTSSSRCARPRPRARARTRPRPTPPPRPRPAPPPSSPSPSCRRRRRHARRARWCRRRRRRRRRRGARGGRRGASCADSRARAERRAGESSHAGAGPGRKFEWRRGERSVCAPAKTASRATEGTARCALDSVGDTSSSDTARHRRSLGHGVSRGGMGCHWGCHGVSWGCHGDP